MLNATEKRFEADIEASLVGQGGYTAGSAAAFSPSTPGGFDANLGLWPGVLVAFLRDSQPDEWQRLAKLHGEALAAHPEWPVIPMASMIESMSTRRAPIGSFAPKSAGAQAFSQLWQAIERRLAA